MNDIHTLSLPPLTPLMSKKEKKEQDSWHKARQAEARKVMMSDKAFVYAMSQLDPQLDKEKPF